MPENLDIYRILSEVGRGRHGQVYRVANTLSGEETALKVFAGCPDGTEILKLIRFRECRHAALLPVRHVDRLPDGRLFCTMELADGRADGEYRPDTLAARGRVPAAELIPILHSLLDGLTELHRHGLTHRGVKPENVLFVHGRPVLSEPAPGTPAPHGAAQDLSDLGRTAYAALTRREWEQTPPRNLPRDAAPVLAFCRAAAAAEPTAASCRAALESRPARCGRRGCRTAVLALILAAGSAIAYSIAAGRGNDAETAAARGEASPKLTADGFRAQVAALLEKFPAEPALWAERARKRYEAVQAEQEALYARAVGQPNGEELLAAAETERRRLSQSDRLYRAGELSEKVRRLLERGGCRPDAELLEQLEAALRERGEVLEALARDEKNRK